MEKNDVKQEKWMKDKSYPFMGDDCLKEELQSFADQYGQEFDDYRKIVEKKRRRN